MSVAADEFERASFDDIEFPYTEISVKGGIRHAVHEFPHTPGGEVEKMGRKLYVISFRAWFHELEDKRLGQLYPELYPTKMHLLREKFEKETTADLLIPTIGKIKAVATDWTSRFDVRSPTGESFELEFVEDQEQATLTGPVGQLAGAAGMTRANDELMAQTILAREKLGANAFGIFQRINDAVTTVQGALGQADAYSRLVEGKIQAVANLCSFADSTLEELQDPSNHFLVTATKNLWLASLDFASDVIQIGQTLRQFTVPKLMAISEISTAIYGSSDKAVDIMQLNAIEDAFAVPSGTVLNYVA